jgi:hypothetical protein
MSREHDRPDPETELRRTFVWERARLQAERLTARETDQAALEPRAVHARLVPLFEPDQPDPASATSSPAAGAEPQPVTAAITAPRRTPRAWLLLVPALTLAVGLAVGFSLASTRVASQPTPAPATRPPVTQPAPAPPTSVVFRPTASPACLETARRGDEIIALLNRNRRAEAADLLVAYSVATRQCRKDASP